MTLKDVIADLATYKPHPLKGKKFKLLLNVGSEKYYNSKPCTIWEMRAFMYDLSNCSNFVDRLEFVEAKTHKPLAMTIFQDFHIMRRKIKRYSLWLKGTNVRASYNETVVPEFQTLRAALAFKRIILNDSPDVTIKVTKYLVHPNNRPK